MTCRRRQSHYDAEAIVLLLIANDGQLDDSNSAIARHFGWDGTERVSVARRHSQWCPAIGYQIPYRDPRHNRPLGLIDQSSTSGLDHIKARILDGLIAYDVRLAQHEVENAVIESSWELWADDARDKGERAIARACDKAAADISATGALTIKTRRLLAKVLA